MADARSAIHWLKKDLPGLEKAVLEVAHHAASSTRRISAERKLDRLLKRIQDLEASLPKEPSSRPQTHETDESDLTDVPDDTMEDAIPVLASDKTSEAVEDTFDATGSTSAVHETYVAVDKNSEAVEDTFDATGSTSAVDETSVAVENPSNTMDSPSATDICTTNHVSATHSEEAKTPSATDMPETNQMGSSAPGTLADDISGIHGFTPLQLAELSEMYSGKPTNDYDIDEYIEKFSDDDTVYQEYADKFKNYPELNAPEIALKVLHALPGFDDISVKALSVLRQWDRLHSSDKICLSILGRVAIRRFVDAYQTDQNATLRPNWVKVLARAEPRFLPEAATTSAPVALAFLRMQNLPEIRCRFHHSERHDDRHAADSVNHLAGCAFPPPDTGEKKPKGKGKGKKAIDDAPVRQDGHLDCGCSLVDALEDWWHFKTARLFSSNPKIRQAFCIQGVIPPIERASLLSALHSPIYIPLRLRYTGVTGWPELAGQWMTPSYELELLRKTRTFISGRIQELENADGLLGVAVAGKRSHKSTDPNGDDIATKKLKA